MIFNITLLIKQLCVIYYCKCILSWLHVINIDMVIKQVIIYINSLKFNHKKLTYKKPNILTEA